MTKTQRILAIALSGVLFLSGFGFGRWTTPSTASAAEGNEGRLTAANPPLSVTPDAAGADQSFYLSDYKTGYSDGYHASVSGQGSGIPNSTRAGYNEGFKEGFANGYQNTNRPSLGQLSAFSNSSVVPETRTVYRTRQNYTRSARPVYVERRGHGSKLRTALTIAAPAALGAGIGALAGGKKGAGVGALLGGGGGALYHLFKNR